jgi:hypothetical protein
MLSTPDSVPAHLYQAEGTGRSAARESVPGWLGSFFLHLLFLVLIVVWMRNTSQTSQSLVRLVPVNIVQLGENTVSPQQRLRATVPQQKSPVQKLVRRSVPAATAPARKPSAQDAVEAQLRSLAHLREPQTNLPVLDNSGASNVDATSDDAAAGSSAAYSVRDYIRNQAERRWSLNVHRLGGHNFSVLLHIELRPNGIIDKAEIVDKARFASDAVWRDIAISARNAVLLSSPIALPSGQLEMPVNFTLKLNPKDMLR